MEAYNNPREITTLCRGLAARSHVLDAAPLRHAREVELSAYAPRSGELRDRCIERRWATLKRFVRRNRTCRFTLRVVGDREAADPILTALGPASYYQDVIQPSNVFISELPARVAEPVYFRCPDAEIFAWPGVTVRFPRDKWRRATVRDALVVLVVPHGDPAASFPSRRAGRTKQLQLPLR
jgi:hypothetical protein